MPKRPPRRRLSSNADGASDPPVAVNPRQVASPRASGASWKVISRELGIGVGTACRALQGLFQKPAGIRPRKCLILRHRNRPVLPFQKQVLLEGAPNRVGCLVGHNEGNRMSAIVEG